MAKRHCGPLLALSLPFASLALVACPQGNEGEGEGEGEGEPGSCDGTDDCLWASGTHDGNPVSLSCTGGETGFAPSSPAAMVYTGVCGQGLGTAERTYTVNLGLWGAAGTGEVAPGTYTYAPGQLSSNGVTLVLQVTENPANQMSEGSINFQSATVVVTEHEAGVRVAGTFDASWSTGVTVDLHSGSWKHMCFEWVGTGCDTGLGMPVPADCTCNTLSPFWAGDVTGGFDWTF